jgi:hypothetical protein
MRRERHIIVITRPTPHPHHRTELNHPSPLSPGKPKGAVIHSASSDSIMLLLGVIIAASLILLFVTRAAKSSNEAVDLPCILDFFKRASSDQSPDERMSNLPMAIRYLNSLAAMHGNKQMRLQAAVFALKSYRDDDRVVLLALTQLSLLVNNYTDTSIQNLLQQDQHVVIKTIQSSLSRAKLVDEPPEKDERLSSEIQRRGCLLLGGCAENIEAAAHIIGSGGMNAIIDALQWYRFHAGVSKWGLWAVFHLCYDRPEYQCELSYIQESHAESSLSNKNCLFTSPQLRL